MNNQGQRGRPHQVSLLQRSLRERDSTAGDAPTYQTCRPRFLCRRSTVARRLEHSHRRRLDPDCGSSLNMKIANHAGALSAWLRFPYMFEGQHAGLTVFRGWSPILALACEKIDRVVLDTRSSFRWVILDEEDGAGRFVYTLGGLPRFFVDVSGRSRRAVVNTNDEALSHVARRIDALVCEAERLTSEACIVCGLRCERKRYFGHDLPLCNVHRPEHLNESDDDGLEGVWRSSIEWEAPSDPAGPT